MPNGFHHIDGLDVVLLNRTEQRYPRFDWGQSSSKLWCVETIGAGGYAPAGKLAVELEARWGKRKRQCAPDAPKELSTFVYGLEKSALKLMGDSKDAGAVRTDHSASILAVDVDLRKGASWGKFCVYGVGKHGVGVDVLVSHRIVDVSPDLNPDELTDDQRGLIGVSVVGLQVQPSPSNTLPAVRSCFEFGDYSSILISSEALHIGRDVLTPVPPDPRPVLGNVIASLEAKHRDVWLAELRLR